MMQDYRMEVTDRRQRQQRRRRRKRRKEESVIREDEGRKERKGRKEGRKGGRLSIGVSDNSYETRERFSLFFREHRLRFGTSVGVID